MRKTQLIALLLALLSFQHLGAQHNMIFRFKAEGFYGKEMNVSNCDYATGGEVAMELPLYGNKNWHYTYNFPSVGFNLGYMNLMGADSSMVRHIAYTYPYFLWPFIHKPMVAINLRMGTGVGMFVDYQETDAHEQFFPYVGVYSLGLTGDVFLSRRLGHPLGRWQVTFGANATWLHNGYMDRHTAVMFIPYANLGVKYTPNIYPLPMKHPAKPVRHVWGIEGSINGGMNQLGREDGYQYYPNGSLNVGLYYPFSNAYRMGFGLDGFFNMAYDSTQRTEFTKRYNYIGETKFKNMIRGGIFWANDVTIERFNAGIHIGFYPYNPIRVPDRLDDGTPLTNRLEDFMYWKFVTKYRFTKHWYATTQLKGHLDAVENLEVGIGYYMADFGARVKSPFSRISFKKDDPNELKVEGETYSKKPFRHRELFDE